MKWIEGLLYFWETYLSRVPKKVTSGIFILCFLISSVLCAFLGIYFLPSKISFDLNKETSQPNFPEVSRISLDPDKLHEVVGRNIFNVDGTTPDAKVQDANFKATVSDALTLTTLPIKLRGVIFSGDPKTGLALLEDTEKNTTDSFLVGDAVTGDATLFAVDREKVIFMNQGHKEYLPLEQITISRSGRKASKVKKSSGTKGTEGATKENTFKEEGFERTGNEITISKDFRQKLLTTEFSKVLQDAKAEPNYINGELNGFKMTKVRSDSIYEKAGIVEDDIVREINGVTLTDPAQAIKLLQSLKNETEIEIKVVRGTKPLTLNMQVK